MTRFERISIRALCGVIAAATFAGVVRADPPTVVVPAKLQVESGEYIVLTAETAAPAVKFVALTPGLRPFPPLLISNKKAYVATAPDGVYRVLAYTGNADGPSDPVICTVTVGAGVPPPVPPTPGPQPQPGPAGKVVRFVVVEDTSAAGQWRGDVMSSPQVIGFYKTAGLSHRLISTQARDRDGKQTGEVKYFLDKTAGKKLPYLLAFDASNNAVFDGPAPLTPEDFVAAIGGAPHHRAMGNLPPPESGRKYQWKRFGDSPNTRVFPRSEWRPVDLSVYLPGVKDQDGIGACNAFATISAVEAARAQAGLPYVRLSCGWLYGRINGGRDQGSMLEDGLAWMVGHGSCTATLVGDLDWRKNPAAADDEAKDYRVVEAYLCPSFDHIASALQQGFLIIEGLMWYDSFKADRDGWLPSRGSGGGGGHALCGYGLAQRNGVWGIRTRNSWGESWGVAGNCVIPEPLFGREIGGYWAVRSVVQTPTGWPVPKASDVIGLSRRQLDPFARPGRRANAAFALAP